MNTASRTEPERATLMTAGVWIFMTWSITAIHHYYTAVLYQTMWRAAFAAYAAIPMIMCIGYLFLYKRFQKKIFLAAYLCLSFVFFFLVVGIWEGAWCHTTKLVLHAFGKRFANAPASWNVPAAPEPTDIFSETTGVLNFVFAGFSFAANVRLIKPRAKGPHRVQTLVGRTQV
ncbi:MAG: hypothetical protein JXP39_09820 [Spirochaetales bacterium]|nr:hypothetical protein [Spirochaetales bacterium]